MKIALTLIVTAALAAGGYFAWQKQRARAEAGAAAGRPATTRVEAKDISFAVTLAGEIAPAEQVSVRPEINGKIATLNVDVGDKVRQGETLFTLDDKELQNQKSATQADIDRARLQLEQSERNFKRNAQLFAEKLVSLEVYDNSKTEAALASNALERANRELAVVQERLTKTVIAAPFDCTVLVRPVSVGQAVSGSGGVGGGTEVLAIADLSQMIINAHVNQADVTRVKAGQEVQVNVEAVTGLSVTGAVERVAPQATIRNNIKGFATRIAIRNIDPRIQPGMTANITIPVASVENVLAVPLSAVYTEQDGRYVYVREGERFARRTVQVGLADYFNAEIVAGLQAGDEVALEQPPATLMVESDQSGGAGRSNGIPLASGRPAGLPAGVAPGALAATNRLGAGAPAKAKRNDT
ncbi:MAG: efflux RND transporter periplasmic adaptor subunit [Verrucomicrobia bacterium]|nr:efflux RND transporter periplasmic adaptor subunit [Verrucomicrobiota bacterium]